MLLILLKSKLPILAARKFLNNYVRNFSVCCNTIDKKDIYNINKGDDNLMERKIDFINEKHIDNYVALLRRFTGSIKRDLDIVLKLLSIDEVYIIAREYIDEIKIGFNEILTDNRMTKPALFISELAYSFYTKSFEVKSLSSSRSLDSDTRNFIINILYQYEPISKGA